MNAHPDEARMDWLELHAWVDNEGGIRVDIGSDRGTLRRAVDAAMRETEAAAGHWIRVDEALPEVRVDVLVIHHAPLGCLQIERARVVIPPEPWYPQWLAGERTLTNVSHWMPLPALPASLLWSSK